MKKTNDLDDPRALVTEGRRLMERLRRFTDALERLERRSVPVEELLLDAFRTFGPLSAYRAQKVTRRGRDRIYEALRRLEGEGRVRRTRGGWELQEPGARLPEPRCAALEPGVDPQIGIKAL